jgi:hypothetical protein
MPLAHVLWDVKKNMVIVDKNEKFNYIMVNNPQFEFFNFSVWKNLM